MKKLLPFLIVLLWTTSAWGSGVLKLKGSDPFIATHKVPDSAGTAYTSADSVQVTVTYQDGTESMSATWFNNADAQAALVNGNLYFFDAWTDMNGSDGLGIYTVLLRWYDGSGAALDFQETYIVQETTRSLEEVDGIIAAILADVTNIDAWDPILDNDSLIIDQSTLEDMTVATVTNITNEVVPSDTNVSGDTIAVVGTDQIMRLRGLLIRGTAGADTAFIAAGYGAGMGGIYKGGATNGRGLLALGQADGHGLVGIGGSNNGHGFFTIGYGIGHGFHSLAQGSGSGARFDGGSTDGHGLYAAGMGAGDGAHFSGGATNGDGVSMAGQGTGLDLNAPLFIDAIFDEDTTGHNTAKSFGLMLKDTTAYQGAGSSAEGIAHAVWGHEADSAWAASSFGDSAKGWGATSASQAVIDSINAILDSLQNHDDWVAQEAGEIGDILDTLQNQDDWVALAANLTHAIDSINGILDTLQLYDTRIDSILANMEDGAITSTKLADDLTFDSLHARTFVINQTGGTGYGLYIGSNQDNDAALMVDGTGTSTDGARFSGTGLDFNFTLNLGDVTDQLDSNEFADDYWDAIRYAPGNGPRLCSLMVVDATPAAITDGSVSMTSGATIRTADISGAGFAVFGLTDATWSGLAYATAYAQDTIPQTFTVTASMRDTITMTAISIPAASAPNMVNAYIYTYDITGDTVVGARMEITPNGIPPFRDTDSNIVMIPRLVSSHSNTDGLVQQEIVRSSEATDLNGNNVTYNFKITKGNYFSALFENRTAPDSASWHIK